MSKVNIVCLKVGHKYDHNYVNKLHSMIQRNVTIPHNFICVTDNDSGLNDSIVVIPAEDDDRMVGWWHKLSLFKPLEIDGRIIYFDLDTVILSNIDNFIQYDGKFAILRNFMNGQKYGSAIMSFNSGFGKEIWDSFQQALNNGRRVYDVPEHKKKLPAGGDQEWIRWHSSVKPDLWQKMFPKQIASYKYHIRNGIRKRRKVKIVCFHGEPRPHEVSHSWIDERIAQLLKKLHDMEINSSKSEDKEKLFLTQKDELEANVENLEALKVDLKNWK